MKRLEDVQIGDKVVVRQCAGAGQEMIEFTKVIKVTKTQITVEKGKMRFMKRNGWKVGECQKMRGWFTFCYTEDEWNR